MYRDSSRPSGPSGEGSQSGAKIDVTNMVHGFARTRPENLLDKKGYSGQPIDLRSNFIPVRNHPEWLVYQYHIGFDPPQDSIHLRKGLMKQHAEKLGTDQPVFDGMTLYLPFKIKELKENKVVWESNDKVTESVNLTIKLTNELPPDSPQVITVLNIINRKAFELMDCKQLGRHFFNPKAHREIPQYNIEIWPGFVSAIRSYESQLLLNLDMAHKLLRIDTVKDFMLAQIERVGLAQAQAICTKELVGTTVMTRYNNRTYKIDDIYWDKNPLDKFEKSDGTSMTYQDYYHQQYNRHVTELKQPLMMSRGKRRGVTGEDESRDVFLVPEFCAMTGLTDTMRADRGTMRELAKHTRVDPGKRVTDARRHLAIMNGNEEVKKLLDQWNLRLDSDLVNVKGRVLDPEPVTYANNRSIDYNPQSADWSRESKGARVLRGVDLVNWTVVYPGSSHPPSGFPACPNFRVVRNFEAMMRQTGPTMGIHVNAPTWAPVNSREECLSKLRNAPKGTQMILVVLPNDEKTLYDDVKKVGCLEQAVSTQCVQLSTLKKQNILQSICTKIMAQINCKMGGALWKVHIPMKKAMVIGYDSYQDSSARGKSVGAAVFSLDASLTRYYSQCEGRRDDCQFDGVHEKSAGEVQRRERWVLSGQNLPIQRRSWRRAGSSCGQLRAPANAESSHGNLRKGLRERRFGGFLLHSGDQADQHEVLPAETGRKLCQSSTGDGRGRRRHQKREVRLFLGAAVRWTGNGHSRELRCHLQQHEGMLARSSPEAQLQAVPHVLQLARNHQSASPVPVCTQTGLLGRSEPS